MCLLASLAVILREEKGSRSLFPSLLCSVAVQGPFKSFHYAGRKQSHDSLAAGPTSVDYIPLSPFPCLSCFSNSPVLYYYYVHFQAPLKGNTECRYCTTQLFSGRIVVHIQKQPRSNFSSEVAQHLFSSLDVPLLSSLSHKYSFLLLYLGHERGTLQGLSFLYLSLMLVKCCSISHSTFVSSMQANVAFVCDEGLLSASSCLLKGQQTLQFKLKQKLGYKSLTCKTWLKASLSFFSCFTPSFQLIAVDESCCFLYYCKRGSRGEASPLRLQLPKQASKAPCVWLEQQNCI